MARALQARTARACGALALALLAAACASGRQTVVTSVPPPPVYTPLPGLNPAERLEEAVSRLRQGQREKARAELKAAIAADPGARSAQKLLASIDADPQALLGEKHYAYTVKPGETLRGLSKRLLGDPLMFYALARYNQIEVPESVTGGQTLMIPGEPPRRVVAVPARRPVAKAAPAPAVQARAADPAQASQLRRTALEQMNRGQIDQAEALLQEANALDPDNALIQADLVRARRIQAGVRPKS